MLTQKQENFTLNLFKGLSQREAYIQAGYLTNYAITVIDSNACRMAANSKVLARLEGLKQKAEDDAVATVQERKQILTEIARGRLTDYITCGPDRDLISVGSESPNTAAFQEITSKTEYDKDGAGVAVITKLKLHSSITAIDTLNKMDGAYAPEKHEHTGKDGGPIEIDHRAVLVSRINSLIERRRTLELSEQPQ